MKKNGSILENPMKANYCGWAFSFSIHLHLVLMVLHKISKHIKWLFLSLRNVEEVLQAFVLLYWLIFVLICSSTLFFFQTVLLTWYYASKLFWHFM